VTPHSIGIGGGDVFHCAPSYSATPTTGDLTAYGQYAAGNLKPGKGKSVTFACLRY
jgi:hypothetical protein